jgi:hypothetical protein
MPRREVGGKKTLCAETTRSQIAKTYDYCDEFGQLLFQVVRMEPKDFRQRAPRQDGGWAWQVKNIRKVLYRLPQLIGADASQLICIVEGEKDVDRLIGLGLVATCNPGGAGKWLAEYSKSFAGRKVAIFPDNDEVGQKHAEDVACSLAGIAQSIKNAKLPNVPAKGNVSDWLDAGGTHDQLLRLIENAPVFCPFQDSPTIPKANEWGAIEPLGITNVPPFPVAALPRALADFVAAEAEATQTPPDLAAMLCLSTCSASVSKKVEVQVRDQWLEPVNLFTVTVLEPGKICAGEHTYAQGAVGLLRFAGLRHEPRDVLRRGSHLDEIGEELRPTAAPLFRHAATPLAAEYTGPRGRSAPDSCPSRAPRMACGRQINASPKCRDLFRAGRVCHRIPRQRGKNPDFARSPHSGSAAVDRIASPSS